ncbi:MAG: sulfatase [Planctomycetaceae bacterium]|nr:sulfatase [Planctomycetaceae bacterium]
MRIIVFRFLMSLLLACASLLHAAEARRPNIVFLMTDDQCTYSLGCYGTPGVKTPNLDQLAADGMVFDRHYDTTAICMASRATVMTGLFEYRTGCNFDSGPMLDSIWQQSYPVQLRRAGYQTAFAGKFGFEVADLPNGKGVLPEEDFDRWGGGPGQTFYETKKNKSMAQYADEYPHSTLSYGAFGRDFIQDATKGEQPFCLSISFKAPHHPVTPDPRFDDVYANAEFTKPRNFGREYGAHFAPQSRMGRQYERFESWGYSTRYNEVMAKYHQQIYAVDVAVGMIRDALTTAGVAENTVIIFTSDNGFLCGSHGYGSKVLPYEEASRVPLIVFDPRHKNSGQKLRCGELTGNCDIAPTILSLAGLQVRSDLDGHNLMALYDNPQAEIHPWLPLMNVWGPEEVHSLAVVTRDQKYVYWPCDKEELKPTEEAYDIAHDPLELRNLCQDSGQTNAVEQLRSLYDEVVEHWKQTGVPYHKYPELREKFVRQ